MCSGQFTSKGTGKYLCIFISPFYPFGFLNLGLVKPRGMRNVSCMFLCFDLIPKAAAYLVPDSNGANYGSQECLIVLENFSGSFDSECYDNKCHRCRA